LDTYTFSLDLPADLVGQFDTFEFRAAGELNQDPAGGDATPVVTPSDDSGFIWTLTGNRGFGSLGLSTFGVDPSTDTSASISGTFASLGSNDASEQGNYEVAQVVVPNGSDGTFEFQFFDDGVPVGGGNGIFTDEPPEGQVVVSDSTILGNGAELLTFVVEIPDGSAGSFDTFELAIVGELIQDPSQSGELVRAGDEDSGFLDLLSAPTAFGGQSLSSFGVDPSTDTSAGISGTFASLGSNEASEQGNYAVAQVVVPAGSSLVYQFRFFDDGVQVGSGSGSVGGALIPEPGGLPLIFIAGIKWLTTRRRYGQLH
jgi:hypothetical protein